MEIIVLRLVHIIGGMVWVGAGVFNALFLMPALRQAGPASGQVMAALRARRLFVFLPIVALLTIASGVRLMAIVSGGFQAAWFQSSSGSAFAWSGLIAIVVFVLGLTVVGPMGNRMAKLGGEMAQAKDDATRAALAPKLASTQKTMTLLGYALTALLLIAAAGMSVGRYM